MKNTVILTACPFCGKKLTGKDLISKEEARWNCEENANPTLCECKDCGIVTIVENQKDY